MMKQAAAPRQYRQLLLQMGHERAECTGTSCSKLWARQPNRAGCNMPLCFAHPLASRHKPLRDSPRKLELRHLCPPGDEHSCSDECHVECQSRSVLPAELPSSPKVACRFAEPSHGEANCTDTGYVFFSVGC